MRDREPCTFWKFQNFRLFLSSSEPKANLQLFNGDILIENINMEIIIKSPD